MQKKTRHIVRKKTYVKNKNDEKKDRNERIIAMLHSEYLHSISNDFVKTCVKVIEKSELKIGDIIIRREIRPMHENSVGYLVQCGVK